MRKLHVRDHVSVEGYMLPYLAGLSVLDGKVYAVSNRFLEKLNLGSTGRLHCREEAFHRHSQKSLHSG